MADLMTPVTRRNIQRRAMAGLDMTPEEEAYLAQLAPAKAARSEALASLTGIPQTGRAWQEAYRDPSIPTLTNAGVNTAFMALRPMAGLGILGAGYGAALAKDIGMPDLMGTPAQAQSTKESRARRDAERATADAAKAKADAEVRLLGAKSEAEARAAAERKAEADAALDRAQKQAEAEEFNRAVRTAEDNRNRELKRKDEGFANTEVGRVYEKTGGFAPMAMGTMGGLIHRMATGPAKGAMDKYVLPMVEGSALTFAGLNAPMVYDALNTPIRNPEKVAAEVYARDLPATHPRRAEWAQYAKDQAEPNPVNARAWEQLTDPWQQVKRLGAAVVEGAPAGLFGRNLPEASKAALQGVGMAPGLVVQGYHKGMAGADAAKLQRMQSQQQMALTAEEMQAALAEARMRGAQRSRDLEAVRPAAPAALAPPAPVAPSPVAAAAGETPAERARRYLMEQP